MIYGIKYSKVGRQGGETDKRSLEQKPEISPHHFSRYKSFWAFVYCSLLNMVTYQAAGCISHL